MNAALATMQISEDDERAVLSAILNDVAAADVARAVLVVGDFYVESHRRIFAAQLALADAGWPIDPHTLCDELQRRGELDAAGGKDFVGWLVDAIPTASNVEYHARIVREKSALRLLAAASEQAAQLAREGRHTAEEIAQRLVSGVSSVPGMRRRPLTIMTDAEIAALPPLEYLVDRILPVDALAAIYGPPSSGKSFLALDLACCVVTGESWLGRTIRHRGVAVYIAAEGRSGLQARLEAWKRSRGYADDACLGVQIVPETINLLDPQDTARLLGTIKRLRPRLVVFDTLHRSMPGGDENSSRDMGLAIDAADRIRRETGATVLLVHHSNSGGEKERGSTSLRGAVDTLLQVSVDDDLRTLACQKQKDGPPFRSITFELSPMFGSCVVSVSNDRETDSIRLTIRLTDRMRTCLIRLNECAHAGEASASVWMEQTRLERNTFYREVSHLVREGYVTAKKVGRSVFYSLTESGRANLSHSSQSVSQSVSPSDVNLSHTPAGVFKTPRGETETNRDELFETEPVQAGRR